MAGPGGGDDDEAHEERQEARDVLGQPGARRLAPCGGLGDGLQQRQYEQRDRDRHDGVGEEHQALGGDARSGLLLVGSHAALYATPGSALSGMYGPAVAYIRRRAAERH